MKELRSVSDFLAVVVVNSRESELEKEKFREKVDDSRIFSGDIAEDGYLNKWVLEFLRNG